MANKKIPLYLKGEVISYAIVDDEDYADLMKYRWRCDQYGYAANVRRKNGKTVTVFMHGYLLPHPKNTDIDHINRNRLDNRKSNLRIATRSQNNMNSKIRIDNKSGIRGVAWHSQSKKWRAYITLKGHQYSLGLYDLVEEAQAARRAKAYELFGEFANE